MKSVSNQVNLWMRNQAHDQTPLQVWQQARTKVWYQTFEQAWDLSFHQLCKKVPSQVRKELWKT